MEGDVRLMGVLLLTASFFVVLMAVPLLTSLDKVVQR